MLVEKRETQSTNDDARALALEGASHGTAVLAARQVGGRGRAGRTFASPEGGLYLSVILRPRLPPARWSVLPIALACETASVLRGFGFDARVKWPNDILLGGRKVGGILLESRLGDAPFLVAGVGVNVAASPADVPEATCLAREGFAPPVRALAERLVDGFLARVGALEHGGGRATMDEVRALCITLGRRVAWEEGEGVAIDVDDGGALVVMDEKGARHKVVAGDVRVKQV